MTAPTMLITPYGRAVLAFPFDRWLVDALKEIPAYARSYDPATKQWTVESPYIAVARRLLTTVFPDADITDESPRFTPPASGTPRTAYHVLHLRETAPRELVEGAYKILARLHHPDAGGDHETMQALNEAIDIIRRRQV
jgi:hypothetical protein